MTSVGLSVAPHDAEWICFVAASVIVSKAAGEITAYSINGSCSLAGLVACAWFSFRTQCDFILGFYGVKKIFTGINPCPHVASASISYISLVFFIFKYYQL